ncbi:hypothetical protein FRC12_019333 [Ceratobasidium sp. 428]|nr:hypothetical protein FRC12_019333 [Ceratobasidium sp. 428]
MKTAAYDNSIFLFCLPPKTTHRLQPLDVGIFNLVQSAWVSLCEDQSAQYDPVTRQNVIKHYMSVRNSKFTEQNVKNAWRRSGHAPLNPGVFTDEDYAPSQATSCVTHLPVGYPDHVPSSSESAQDSESEAESSAGTASEEWDIDSDDYLERPIVIYGEGDVSDASYQAESDASEYLTYKVPTTRHIAQTSSIPKKRRANEAEILRAQLEQAEVQLGMVTSQLDAANAHCTLMERANQQLKDQVEASEQARKKTKRSTNPFRDNKIGFLTHPEGKANHERHVAEEEAEARAAAEREREKERQEEAILEARTQLAHNDNYVFPGTVASYKYVKLDSLRDLAASLGVEWKGIKKADLFEAVVEHFEANPELKTHIRYAGLFAQRRGRLD